MEVGGDQGMLQLQAGGDGGQVCQGRCRLAQQQVGVGCQVKLGVLGRRVRENERLRGFKTEICLW